MNTAELVVAAKDYLIQTALSYEGVTESGGDNSGPEVEAFQKAVDGRAVKESWCFEGCVEILTETGWVAFEALQDGVRVAQVDQGGVVSFVVPSAHIRKIYTGGGFHVKTRSLDFRVDAGHRFWGVFNNSQSPRFGTLTEVTHSLQIPAARAGATGSGLSPYEIALLAAYLAEGFNGTTRSGKGRIRVQVSKEREREALEALHPVAKSTAGRVYGDTTKTPLTLYGFEVPPVFDTLFCGYKLLKWDVVNSFTPAEAALFLEHYTKFDGNIPRQGSTSRRIFCSDPAQFDRLVALATLAGYIPSVTQQESGFATGKTGNILRYALNKQSRILRKAHIAEIEMREEPLFCVEVPEGRILVRDKKGNPFISGNCMAFMQFCLKQTLEAFADQDLATSVFGEPKGGEHCMTVWNNSDPAALSNEPAAGSLVVWNHVGTSNGHTGLVVSVNPDGTFETIEGNTGPGSNVERNGDGVYRKHRRLVFQGAPGSMVVVGFIDPFLVEEDSQG